MQVAKHIADDGRTQQAIADAAGVHVHQVNRWARGRGVPAVANLIRLADALSCSVDDLLGRPVPVVLAKVPTDQLLAEVARRTS